MASAVQNRPVLHHDGRFKHVLDEARAAMSRFRAGSRPNAPDPSDVPAFTVHTTVTSWERAKPARYLPD
jgi:hypothetical protein